MCLREVTVPLTALLDTGNFLVEPISGKPVSVLEEAYLLPYFSRKELAQQFRLIPYRSVGRSHGVMQGVIFDRMDLQKGRKKKSIKEPMIGIVRGTISANGAYQMLLHSDLLS